MDRILRWAVPDHAIWGVHDDLCVAAEHVAAILGGVAMRLDELARWAQYIHAERLRTGAAWELPEVADAIGQTWVH